MNRTLVSPVISAMKKTLRKARRFPRTWFLLGLCALLVGIGLVVVQRLHPTHLQQAEKALADHDLAEALYHLRQIPTDSPNYLAAVRQIAVICILSKRNDEAERVLRQLEQVDPNDFGVQLSLAELYFHQQDHKRALPHALRAAELRPGRVGTYLLIAEIRDSLRQRPDMIPPLQKAIELDPSQYDAHLNLAYAYQASGRLDEARKEANWCLQRKPDEVFAYRTLASVARDEGRFDVAQQQLEKALKLDPDDVDCRILEADLLMYRRQPEEAYKRLKPLYEKHKETFRYLGSLARAAAASGRTDEARKLHGKISRRFNSKLNSKLNRHLHTKPQ